MRSRSYHFIPAHRPELFARADQLGADAVVFDLEDAVPAARKEAARGNLHDFLRRTTGSCRYVRVHEAGSEECNQDLDLLRELPGVGLVLPKVRGPEILDTVAGRFEMSGRPLILTLETFEGVASLGALLGQVGCPLEGIALGFEDLLAGLPHPADDLQPLIRAIRVEVAIQCRARGLAAIDGICPVIDDPGVVEGDAREARSCGLTGKFSIHPVQVPIINRAFSPDASLVQWARDIARLTDLKASLGYVRLGDQIITPPKIKKARTVLETVDSECHEHQS